MVISIIPIVSIVQIYNTITKNTTYCIVFLQIDRFLNAGKGFKMTIKSIEVNYIPVGLEKSKLYDDLYD
jgi:hypothetical protein